MEFIFLVDKNKVKTESYSSQLQTHYSSGFQQHWQQLKWLQTYGNASYKYL